MQEGLRQTEQHRVIEKLVSIYEEAFDHDGFAEIKVEIRILRRGQKEVILHYGKQYRFIVDSTRRGRNPAPRPNDCPPHEPRPGADKPPR